MSLITRHGLHRVDFSDARNEHGFPVCCNHDCNESDDCPVRQSEVVEISPATVVLLAALVPAISFGLFWLVVTYVFPFLARL